ncbi:hypothetical protein RMATCC62417_07719 [Rhizopus microsporus]|nr:hypothetical protein RMATCC62417_07719 [Rhizopus microsporus]
MVLGKLDIKVDIKLDEDKKYFPGDTIVGKIILRANQNHTLRKLWLIWTGRIQVQPRENEKESHDYFVDCWKLCSPIFKSPVRIDKNIPIYHTAFVNYSPNENTNDDESEPMLLELAKNKPVAFAFEAKVPDDIPLPSSTKNEFAAHKIVYYLEAFTGTSHVFSKSRAIQVYEPIYVMTPLMMTPQRAERVFSVVANSKHFCTSSMQLIVPCQGHIQGTIVPISITVQSEYELTRKQGISVSLLRTHEVMVNGRKFSSFVEPVSRSVGDLHLTSQNGNPSQTVEIKLQIPKDAVPTIAMEQSKIMAVNYYIRALVYAHEGTYISQDLQESQFMSAELPFIIGTLKEPPAALSSPPISPQTSPALSAKSLSSRNAKNDPISSLSTVSVTNNTTTTGSESIHNHVPSTSTSTVVSNEGGMDDKKEKLSTVGSLFKRSSSGKISGDKNKNKTTNKRSLFSSFFSKHAKKPIEQDDRMTESNIEYTDEAEKQGERVEFDDEAEKEDMMEKVDVKEEGGYSNVIHYRPFADSDSEDDDNAAELTILNKPDEIHVSEAKEKPHLKE